MKIKRSSAVLLHITSLPSRFGIGDMGETAYKFIDFLQASGHRYWQLLPLNPTDEMFGHSPYSSNSAFAGNPLLISPQVLVADGFLEEEDIDHNIHFQEGKVEFDEVSDYKFRILEKAFKKFSKDAVNKKDYEYFCRESNDWLEDYALYKALKAAYKSGWTEWPQAIRDRQPKALAEQRKLLSKDIEKYKFYQFLFFSQWQKLVDYSHMKEIGFVGDIPFYINHDSADCWSHTAYFKLDESKNPTMVSGVPPDYFSETGQLWGTPVYDWKVLEKNKFDWWINRLGQNLRLYDIVRLDHFRAFSAYWEVPVDEETAINGKWVKIPGKAFFTEVKNQFPKMPFIAEDLGELDEPVYQLIKGFDFPIMKVLQFAFGEDMGTNPYILHNHVKNSVAFTGTHDNNTTVGWYQAAGRAERKRISEYIGTGVSVKNIHQILHRHVLMSVSQLAVVPIQDLLGLDESAIMNRPGTSKGNWSWQLTKDQIPMDKAEEYKNLNITYGRYEKKIKTEKAAGQKKQKSDPTELQSKG